MEIRRLCSAIKSFSFISIVSVEMTPEEEKALVEELRQLPDFDRLPFPKEWYDKYNIPRPKLQNFKDFIDSNQWFIKHFNPEVKRESRDALPGGVRPVASLEAPVLEVVQSTLAQSESECRQEMPPLLEDSTGTSETKSQG